MPRPKPTNVVTGTGTKVAVHCSGAWHWLWFDPSGAVTMLDHSAKAEAVLAYAGGAMPFCIAYMEALRGTTRFTLDRQTTQATARGMTFWATRLTEQNDRHAARTQASIRHRDHMHYDERPGNISSLNAGLDYLRSWHRERVLVAFRLAMQEFQSLPEQPLKDLVVDPSYSDSVLMGRLLASEKTHKTYAIQINKWYWTAFHNFQHVTLHGLPVFVISGTRRASDKAIVLAIHEVGDRLETKDYLVAPVKDSVPLRWTVQETSV